MNSRDVNNVSGVRSKGKMPSLSSGLQGESEQSRSRAQGVQIPASVMGAVESMDLPVVTGVGDGSVPVVTGNGGRIHAPAMGTGVEETLEPARVGTMRMSSSGSFNTPALVDTHENRAGMTARAGHLPQLCPQKILGFTADNLRDRGEFPASNLRSLWTSEVHKACQAAREPSKSAQTQPGIESAAVGQIGGNMGDFCKDLLATIESIKRQPSRIVVDASEEEKEEKNRELTLSFTYLEAAVRNDCNSMVGALAYMRDTVHQYLKKDLISVANSELLELMIEVLYSLGAGEQVQTMREWYLNRLCQALEREGADVGLASIDEASTGWEQISLFKRAKDLPDQVGAFLTEHGVMKTANDEYREQAGLLRSTVAGLPEQMDNIVQSVLVRRDMGVWAMYRLVRCGRMKEVDVPSEVDKRLLQFQGLLKASFNEILEPVDEQIRRLSRFFKDKAVKYEFFKLFAVIEDLASMKVSLSMLRTQLVYLRSETSQQNTVV